MEERDGKEMKRNENRKGKVVCGVGGGEGDSLDPFFPSLSINAFSKAYSLGGCLRTGFNAKFVGFFPGACLFWLLTF